MPEYEVFVPETLDDAAVYALFCRVLTSIGIAERPASLDEPWIVDTPELGTCYAAEAAAYNHALVDDTPLELAYDVECEDRYRRTLAYVTANGIDVSRELVARGYARVLHIPPNGATRIAEFKALETGARAAQLGLWSACR